MYNTGQKPKLPKEYARWSSLVFSIIALIVLAALAGQQLDKLTKFNRPYCTLLLTLASVGFSFYLLVKEVSKEK